jgi:hypothetical protein
MRFFTIILTALITTTTTTTTTTTLLRVLRGPTSPFFKAVSAA